MLLESNKSFFAIATNTSLRAAAVEAFLPAGTFAPGQSTPFARNGVTPGMTQWLAQSAIGRVVDPGVSQQQQPPSAAASHLSPHLEGADGG